MEWKLYYADELAQAWGGKAVRDALEQHAAGDPVIQAAMQTGGWVSFPHVTLRDSALPIARVVQSVLASGKQRVLALGVLHGGTLPVAYRQAWAAFKGAGPLAADVFPRFAGAFFMPGDIATPFGTVGAGPWPRQSAVIREDAALLAGEFSLDLFVALLAAAAQLHGVRPPAVTRLFVGAVRHPNGSFELAPALAGAIGALTDGDTACVATGDLAHLGQGYNTASEVAALPADLPLLTARLRADILEQHAAALARRDHATAWAIASRWLNDQRHMLPVLAELLGPQARYALLSLSLSDYTHINGVPPPCYVAAALGLFHRAAPAPAPTRGWPPC